MAYRYSLTFKGSTREQIVNAKNYIIQAGGILIGNMEKGTFDLYNPLCNIVGTYKIVNQSLQIVIHQKPMLISFDNLRNELENYFKFDTALMVC